MSEEVVTQRRKQRGRPKQGTEKLEGISLTLPPGDIARLEAEAVETGARSVSAIVRIAVTEHLRRTDKKRDRQI